MKIKLIIITVMAYWKEKQLERKIDIEKLDWIYSKTAQIILLTYALLVDYLRLHVTHGSECNVFCINYAK